MMEFDILSQDHNKGRDQDISNLMKRAREAFNSQFQVPTLKSDRKGVPDEADLHWKKVINRNEIRDYITDSIFNLR